jgi:hypothetical protein
MLKVLGKPRLLFRLGRWMCVCLARNKLKGPLPDAIRPRRILGYDCWCDRSD